MSQSTLPRTVASTVQSVFFLLDPHGGQRTARRNALTALHLDDAAARGRRLAATPPAPPRAVQGSVPAAR